MNKTIYLECRKIMKTFIKKNYWQTFTSADLFYIAEMRKKYLFTFVEQFFGDSFGCQLFFNANGFNYVHDILTTSNENSVSILDCDSICAAFISKSDLKKEEIDFLRKNNIRISAENNLIVYRFASGYGQKIASDHDLEIYQMVLEYMASIISNEYNDIVSNFKESNATVAIMDVKNMQYSIIYRPLPYLETKIRELKGNVEFANEFKDKPYLNDDCYLFASYLPIVIKETNVRPLVLYFYFPKTKQHYFKYIMDEPKEYKNCIFGILYDVFTEIGVPTRMLFNNRIIYAAVKKTIDLMNVENVFLRENADVDLNINTFLSKIYRNSDDEFIEGEKCVRLLMDTITLTLNEITDDDLDSFEDNESEFVS